MCLWGKVTKTFTKRNLSLEGAQISTVMTASSTGRHRNNNDGLQQQQSK
jgi:hypothetical protein